jgi:hypothetical protein
VVAAAHHRDYNFPRGASGETRVVQAPGAEAIPSGDNGTCKSVRIHGEWVQRCHFEGGQGAGQAPAPQSPQPAQPAPQ